MAAGAAAVALDALGADQGIAPIVAGARTAAAEGIRLRVFGRTAELAELRGVDGSRALRGARGDHATTTTRCPRSARTRTRRSCAAAADVADGNSAALVSAGPTGATMAAATFGIKRLRGVHRPALAVQLPSPARRGRPVLMLDVGASTEARAQHLIQFAHLGSAFARVVLGVERPRLALLSVGEESKKGNPIVVEAHEELAASGGDFEFAGNIEGRDLLTGDADVVVTDGFTGNVTLKTIEGTAKAVVRRRARRGALQPARRRRWPAAAPGALRPAPRDGPGHHRRRDPARPAPGHGRRPRQLRARGRRQRDPARRPRRPRERGRAHRRAARRHPARAAGFAGAMRR